uniref:Bestrophin homolog n=1 Tax=Caenorhabditis tropicalis TaxID=1561998 RepID=A0A1I7TFX6_9PELO
MLGFYVSIVYNRWTKVFDNVGWIDTSALTIAQYIRGTSERARLIRRNCIRYMIVAQAMVFRDVSPAIRRRFPTMRHLISAGLLTDDEMREYDSIVSPQSKYWQPIQWLFSLVTVAKDEGLIADYYLYVDLSESDLDNGLISFVRRRSKSTGEDDASSIHTETTRVNSNASMLPRYMWAQQRNKISNAVSKFYMSEPEPRRASVCVAALDLNHRKLSTDSRDSKKPEKFEDIKIDVPALVQERIRTVKQQSVKIEIPEDNLNQSHITSMTTPTFSEEKSSVYKIKPTLNS